MSLCGVILGLLDGFDNVMVKPFVPDGSVLAFDTCVLLRLAGVDVQDMTCPPVIPRS